MNYFIIIMFAVLVFMAFVIFIIGDKNKRLEQRLNGYQIENENLQKNIAYLVKHTEEITKIQKEADRINEKINGAKTDEEIADIVSAIISANNDRVHNDKK